MAESQSTALPPLEERPLVTFALFAYNQEKYIREAVEGAFAQTYEPLEIILSDDCSTDRTFEIMEEMAAGYIGPHRVRAVRNAVNLGVVPHVLARGREAQGEIVIVAAGDDVSRAERTETLVREFSGNPRTFAVSSAFDLVSENGEILSKNNCVPIAVKNRKKYTTFLHTKASDYVVIQGSTASYRKNVFLLPLPEFPILISEDNLFNFLIYAHGGTVIRCKASLVMYRVHDRALSNRESKKVSLEIAEKESVLSAIKGINKAKVFRWIAQECSRPDMVDHKSIDAALRRDKIIQAWAEHSSLRRFYLLMIELIIHNGELAKWQISRMFGTPSNYQPKRLISRLQRRYQ